MCTATQIVRQLHNASSSDRVSRDPRATRTLPKAYDFLTDRQPTHTSLYEFAIDYWARTLERKRDFIHTKSLSRRNIGNSGIIHKNQ